METTENPWKILGSEVKYHNKWIQVTQHEVLNPNGGPGIYGVVHFKNVAVGIVAMDEAQHIYLVGQYRFPLEQFSWEIPEGGGPLGEDTLDAAKRELLEETGLVARHWTPIVHMHLSNSVSDEYSIIYLARNLEQHTATPEETEQLVVMKLPFDKAWRMIEEGLITDAMSVAAIQKVKWMLADGRLS